MTVGQAADLGLSRHSVARLVSMGEWRRIGPSLVFVHDLDPPWDALAWAGVLYAGGDARIGDEAAAYLHGLIDAPPDQIVILLPHHRRLSCRPPWIFRRERAGARSARSPGSLPRIPVEDTVLDLCVDERSAVHWITRAIQRRRTTLARIRDAAEERARLPCRALLSDLLAETRNGVESPLEHHYLRDVEQAHGLPRGTRQLRSGRTRGQRDVSYSEFGLLVELDGHLGHDGMGRFRDMRRDNASALDGRVTLRYGWIDVAEDPCAVAYQVAEVLVRRGWSALPTRCPRCPAGTGEIGEYLAG